jgi:hypothetical protein
MDLRVLQTSIPAPSATSVNPAPATSPTGVPVTGNSSGGLGFAGGAGGTGGTGGFGGIGGGGQTVHGGGGQTCVHGSGGGGQTCLHGSGGVQASLHGSVGGLQSRSHGCSSETACAAAFGAGATK